MTNENKEIQKTNSENKFCKESTTAWAEVAGIVAIPVVVVVTGMGSISGLYYILNKISGAGIMYENYENRINQEYQKIRDNYFDSTSTKQDSINFYFENGLEKNVRLLSPSIEEKERIVQKYNDSLK